MASYTQLFDGKRAVLSRKIDVSNDFLSLLQDSGVITRNHRAKIEIKKINSERVEVLLNILEKRDDRTVKDFFRALELSGQSHVIDILLSESGMTRTADPHPENEDMRRDSLRFRPTREGLSDRVNLIEDPPSSIQPTGNWFSSSFARNLRLGLILTLLGVAFLYMKSTSDTENSARRTSSRGLFQEMFHGRRSDLVMNIDVSHGLWISLKDKNLLTEWQIKDCQAQKNEYEQIGKLLDLLEFQKDSRVPMFCEALAETGNDKVLAEFFQNVCASFIRN